MFVCLFVRSSAIRSFVHSFIYSFIPLFVIHSFVRSCVRLFIRSFTRTFIHSFIHSLFIRSFIHSSFTRSFIHSFVPLFIRTSIFHLLLRIRPLVHLFIHPFGQSVILLICHILFLLTIHPLSCSVYSSFLSFSSFLSLISSFPQSAI